MSDKGNTEKSEKIGKGKGLIGIVLRFLLIIVGGALLYFNEYKVIKKQMALKEGTASVVTANANEILPQNKGNLIHVSGKLSTSKPLEDPDFGLKVDAVHLKRDVETYQWIEKIELVEKEGEDDERKYIYTKQWKSGLTNSRSYHDTLGHRNPQRLKYTSKWYIADEVKLGAYKLAGVFVNRISFESDLYLAEFSNFDTIAGIKIIDNKVYIGSQSTEAPKIGDIRISYKIVKPQQVSVVGKQTRSGIDTYVTSNKTRIHLLEKGEVTAEEMFKEEIQNNSYMEWLYRLVCFLILFFGFMVIYKFTQKNLSDKGLAKRLKSNGLMKFSLYGSVFVFFAIVAAVWNFTSNLVAIGSAVLSVLALVLTLVGSKKEA